MKYTVTYPTQSGDQSAKYETHEQARKFADEIALYFRHSGCDVERTEDGWTLDRTCYIRIKEYPA